jgi:L-lactate dehydrogenase (cytochrome)
MISFSQVQERNSRDNLWVVIHGSVYDLTAFVNEHPGGSKVILQVAGKDATKEFSMYHPPDMMDRFLDKKFHLGKLDISTAPKEREEDQSSAKIAPPLSKILNTFDFESVAKEILTPEAWAYYSSGGDNELTLQENHAAFSRIWLKPRVLINVKKVNTSTSLLGTKTSLPLYITATALGKLGHRDGEVVLTRAAGSKNIIQMIPTLASCSIDELVSARAPTQTQWFQLYVNSSKLVLI